MNQSIFVPARLRLARELAEITQAGLAGQLGVSPAAISQFESGATRPSVGTVAQLCNLLEVPGDFFTTPLVETHEGFFRSLRRTPVGKRRRARGYGHVAHDVASHPLTQALLPPVAVPRSDEPSLSATRAEIEVVARAVRRAWALPAGPVIDLVQVIEEHGVVVMRLPFVSTEVDAFSLPFDDRPVIVLSADKNDKARSRFDAAHELGHLVMHGNQVWGLKEIETQAHWFAAEFLMPSEEIIEELPADVDWPRLFDLKRRWQVSLAALLFRAKTLGRISEMQYVAAVKAASARGWRRVEPVPLGPPEQPAHLRRCLMELNSRTLDTFLPAQVVTELLRANAA